MNLDRGIRAHQLLPLRKPENGEGSVPENTEDAILDTRHKKGEDSLVWQSSVSWPDTLTVGGKIVPCKIENNHSKASLKKGASLYTPCMIYKSDNTSTESSLDLGHYGDHRGIDILYLSVNPILSKSPVYDQEDDSQKEFSLSLKKFDLLYHKPFYSQEDTHIHQEIYQNPEGEWIVSPPGQSNTRPLYGFGGYYKPGLFPAHIQPVYFFINDSPHHTRLHLGLSDYWNHKGMTLTTPGMHNNITYFLNDPVSFEQSLSLGKALEEGCAHIILMPTHPSKNLSSENRKKLYRSCAYQNFKADDDTLTIIFKKD